MAPKRTIEACDEVLNCLSEKQKERIQAVSLDLWLAFESSVEANLSNDRIVHDPFHVATYLNEAVDKVRRAENKELVSQGDDRLKGSKHTLLYNPENLTEASNEQLSKILQAYLKTSRASQLKEWFRYFWKEDDAVGGRRFFGDWYSRAIRSRLHPVRQVAHMLKSRLHRIVTWFTNRISNGRAEGFNSRNQYLKSVARGFRRFQHYQKHKFYSHEDLRRALKNGPLMSDTPQRDCGLIDLRRQRTSPEPPGSRCFSLAIQYFDLGMPDRSKTRRAVSPPGTIISVFILISPADLQRGDF